MSSRFMSFHKEKGKQSPVTETAVEEKERWRKTDRRV